MLIIAYYFVHLYHNHIEETTTLKNILVILQFSHITRHYLQAPISTVLNSTDMIP